MVLNFKLMFLLFRCAIFFSVMLLLFSLVLPVTTGNVARLVLGVAATLVANYMKKRRRITRWR
jgi:hypothetical protein